MLPLVAKGNNAVPYVISLLSSLSLVRTNIFFFFFKYSLLSTMICWVFLFLLSPMTSWADNSFSAFIVIASCSLICFSHKLQSPVHVNALSFLTPLSGRLLLQARGVRRGTSFFSHLWDLPGQGLVRRKRKRTGVFYLVLLKPS